MAPLPANGQSTDQPPPEHEHKTWSTPTIVLGAVFLFIIVALIITFIAFYIHKRKQRNKLPKEHRPKSYHPFRTESMDKSALLSNIPSSDEERSSMFSRERSSMTVYVDQAATSRRVSDQSMSTVSLIPLQVTPPVRQESLSGKISNGSGISASSSNYSRVGPSLSPIAQEYGSGDLGTRPTRPRSTSASSVRYYRASMDGGMVPPVPIPKIVHTLSE